MAEKRQKPPQHSFLLDERDPSYDYDYRNAHGVGEMQKVRTMSLANIVRKLHDFY
jgi:hypothetical protein